MAAADLRPQQANGAAERRLGDAAWVGLASERDGQALNALPNVEPSKSAQHYRCQNQQGYLPRWPL